MKKLFILPVIAIVGILSSCIESKGDNASASMGFAVTCTNIIHEDSSLHTYNALINSALLHDSLIYAFTEEAEVNYGHVKDAQSKCLEQALERYKKRVPSRLTYSLDKIKENIWADKAFADSLAKYQKYEDIPLKPFKVCRSLITTIEYNVYTVYSDTLSIK